MKILGWRYDVQSIGWLLGCLEYENGPHVSHTYSRGFEYLDVDEGQAVGGQGKWNDQGNKAATTIVMSTKSIRDYLTHLLEMETTRRLHIANERQHVGHWALRVGGSRRRRQLENEVAGRHRQSRATPLQMPGKTKAPGKPCSFSTAGGETSKWGRNERR